MKKNFIILSAMMISGISFAQIGINSTLPKATLDVTAKTTTGNLTTDGAEGIIAPRLTGDQMKSKDALYLADQTGAIVYATAAVTTPTGKTINVTSPGYYYYDHANLIWQKIANPIAGTDTTNDAWINGSNEVLLGTLSDGTTARPNSAAFRIANDGSTVIGSTQPAGVYKLQVVNPNGQSLFGVKAYGAASTSANRPYIDMIAIGGTEAVPEDINAGTLAGVLEFKGRIGGLQQQLSSITSVYTGDGTTNKAKMYLSSAGSNVANQIVLSDDGNMGIGTANPGQKLDVSGQVIIRTLPAGDAANDALVTADTNGNLRKLSVASAGLDATNDAWINDPANSRVNLLTKSDGTTRTPDANVAVTDNGRIVVGNTTGTSALTIQNNISDDTGDDIEIKSFGTTTPGFIIRRSRGTAAAPANLVSNDQLFAQLNYGRVAGLERVFNIVDTRTTDGTTSTYFLRNLDNSGNIQRAFTIDGSKNNSIGLGDVAPTSTVTVGGSFSAPIRTFSGNITALDYTVIGSGNVVLPTATGITGRMYNIIFTTTNYTVSVIAGGGSLALDGTALTSYSISSTQPQITVQSNGTNWLIVAKR